jgi:hypothetical protein
MKIIIKPAFKRDSDRIRNTKLLGALFNKIEEIERAKTKENITGLKKLRGYSTHYRIYLKVSRQSYRIGAILKGNQYGLSGFFPEGLFIVNSPSAIKQII